MSKQNNSKKFELSEKAKENLFSGFCFTTVFGGIILAILFSCGVQIPVFVMILMGIMAITYCSIIIGGLVNASMTLGR